MTRYNYQKKLQEVWEHAVAEYERGNRDPESYFMGESRAFLDRIGATCREVYDFAEDYVSAGEPDFTTFALLADIRRHYFENVQQGQRSSKELDPETLPPKTAAAEGITWLPRIIEKAKAKLHGELGQHIMYGCGGDRRFLKEHDIHPAEFLRVVEMHEGNDQAVVNWVVERSRTAKVG